MAPHSSHLAPARIPRAELEAVTRDVDRLARELSAVALIWLYGNPERDYRDSLPQHRRTRR